MESHAMKFDVRTRVECPETENDVVQAEDLVVDEPLRHVEGAPPHQEQPEQEPGRPRRVRLPRRAPQQDEAGDGRGVGGGVEEAVTKRVHPQAGHGIR